MVFSSTLCYGCLGMALLEIYKVKIIIDTREQLPLDFSFCENVTETIRTALPVGDYSCEFKNGYVPLVVFERKSIPDLFGTLSQDYPRFKKELERAQEAGIKVILIIEGTLADVQLGTMHSNRDGLSVAKQMFTMWIKYDVMPVFCFDRNEMTNYIIHYYSAIGRKAVADMKGKQ